MWSPRLDLVSMFAISASGEYIKLTGKQLPGYGYHNKDMCCRLQAKSAWSLPAQSS